MKLLPAYCSYSFFDALVNNSAIDLLDIDYIAINKSRIELSQLVIKGLDITIDLDAEKINELLEKPQTCNPYIRSLIKNSRLHPDKDIFLKIRNNEKDFSDKLPCFSQFFVSSDYDGITDNAERTTGYLFNSINKPETFQRLTSLQIEPFKKDEFKDWNFLKNYKLSHHSIIVVDPHLLRGDDKHVLNLIKEIAPNKLNTTYHITLVFSKESIDERFHDKLAVKIKDKTDSLSNNLKKSVSINFSIEYLVYNGEDFHDRYIITNNFMIYSGYGFDLINSQKKAKKQTSWVVINHAKIQDSKIPGNEKPHYVTVMNFIEQIKTWITRKENGSSVVFNNPILK